MLHEASDRDRLFGEFAVEWGLLSQEVLEELTAESTSQGQNSITNLIVQRASLTDRDRSALEWLVGRTLERSGSTDAAGDNLESTFDETDLKVSPAADDETQLSTMMQTPQGDAMISASNLSRPPVEDEDKRYEKKLFHAAGGIGQIWLTEDVNIGREVALKQLLPERRDENTTRRSFVEAKITGQLCHPGLRLTC